MAEDGSRSFTIVEQQGGLDEVKLVTAATLGELKSRALASVQVPVVRLVASKLYWKSMRSAPRPIAPQRHCSPV